MHTALSMHHMHPHRREDALNKASDVQKTEEPAAASEAAPAEEKPAFSVGWNACESFAVLCMHIVCMMLIAYMCTIWLLHDCAHQQQQRTCICSYVFAFNNISFHRGLATWRTFTSRKWIDRPLHRPLHRPLLLLQARPPRKTPPPPSLVALVGFHLVGVPKPKMHPLQQPHQSWKSPRRLKRPRSLKRPRL